VVLGELLQRSAVEHGGLHGRDATGRDGDERGGAGAAFEVRALAEQRAGAVLGQSRAVLLDAAFTRRNSGLPPCMICVDRLRSSAVSTAVTSAFESVSPHGE
jgi:hypothetical protein